jgi:pimeloyl-[acyl-carrier protein] methyl ester esterase
MPKKILEEATHIVLINSFNNFLPLSNKRNFILRSLKRMEQKFIKDEPKDMLKEFIFRSFMPNHMNNSFKNIFYKSLESLNKTLLLSDLKELYINRDFQVFLRKDCKIIFIKSENDLILDNESNNNFLDSLNKKLERKPILIKLAKQGHCLNNLNLYEILRNKLND